MVTVNDHFSFSSYSHSISTWNTSEYKLANLHFLLNMLHGKYDPASIKILKNPATSKITFPNKREKCNYLFTVKSISSSFLFSFHSFTVVFHQAYNLKKIVHNTENLAKVFF